MNPDRSGCLSQIVRYVLPAGCVAASFFALVLLVSAGCSHPPYATERPSTVALFTSLDGGLRYPVPQGWFDATAHAKDPRPVVWLVRNDYGASITINIITIDEETRRGFSHGGLARTAQLSMQLNMNTRAAVLLQSPTMKRVEGRDFCTYQIQEPATRERIRVVLFDTGARVYEVTALDSGERPSGPVGSAVLEQLLASLRW